MATADQQHVDEALAANAAQVALLVDLERRAQEQASGFLRRLLRGSFRTLTNQYIIQFGSLDAAPDPLRMEPLIADFTADLQDLRGYDPSTAIAPYADTAQRAGVVWGLLDAPPEARPGELLGAQSPEVERILSEIPDNVSAAIDQTERLAQTVPVSSWSDVVTLYGKASQAASSVDRSAATAVSTAMNDAVGQVARAHGARVLWVAEPNACVVCLRLSGHLADPATGQWFDEEATFGRPGSAPAVWPPGQPLMRPPRHPHCRCVTQVWWGDVRGTRVVDLPAALQREARRSILLGRALPTESNNVRIDAADRLLRIGSGLPRTVEARSRRAVQTGRFINRVK